MNVGLYIVENMQIKLGDTLDNIIKDIESKGIDYKIPYRGKTEEHKNNVEESVVIFLEKTNVELNILNGEVIYIKSSNLQSNKLMDINNSDSTVKTLKNIIKEVCNTFKITENNVTVESFDSKAFNTMLKLKVDTSHKVRVSIICDAFNKAHIHTIRLI